MKYLIDYTEELQTKLLSDTQSFFAFSDKQLKENAVKGVKYVNAGAGLICPKENVEILLKGLTKIQEEGIKQDIEENGKPYIIKRELANHEAYYTGCIESTIDALEGYDISTNEIIEIYNQNKSNEIW